MSGPGRWRCRRNWRGLARAVESREEGNILVLRERPHVGLDIETGVPGFGRVHELSTGCEGRGDIFWRAGLTTLLLEHLVNGLCPVAPVRENRCFVPAGRSIVVPCCVHIHFVTVLPSQHAITYGITGCDSVLQDILQTFAAIATACHVEAVMECGVREVGVRFEESGSDLDAGWVVGGDCLVPGADHGKGLVRVEGGQVLRVAAHADYWGGAL